MDIEEYKEIYFLGDSADVCTEGLNILLYEFIYFRGVYEVNWNMVKDEYLLVVVC